MSSKESLMNQIAKKEAELEQLKQEMYIMSNNLGYKVAVWKLPENKQANIELYKIQQRIANREQTLRKLYTQLNQM